MDPIFFNHDGRNLEVRATRTPDGLTVRVFEDGHRATAVSYNVRYDTEIAGAWQGMNLGADLMRMAKDDVESGVVPLLDP